MHIFNPTNNMIFCSWYVQENEILHKILKVSSPIPIIAMATIATKSDGYFFRLLVIHLSWLFKHACILVEGRLISDQLSIFYIYI